MPILLFPFGAGIQDPIPEPTTPTAVRLLVARRRRTDQIAEPNTNSLVARDRPNTLKGTDT